MTIKAHTQKIWLHFLSDNLFRNSVYLMMTTGVMGMFGIAFWFVSTHVFSPDQIGLGTTIVSSMSLISLVSLLGFNTTFVRFLPTSKNRNEDINTGSLLVIIASTILSIVYILCIPFFSPKLAIIHDNTWYAIGFVILTILASVNTLTDSIFIAYRSAQYNLITDGFIISTAKLFLPFVFVGLGAYGVFAASGFATSIGMIASVAFLFYKFDYRPKLAIHMPTLQKVLRYSSSNYIASLISMFPTFIVPIIIINHLGAEPAAYYYMAFMLMNMLYSISGSVTQSLFAEGSHDAKKLHDLLKRSLVILATIMVPAGIVAALFGPLVLQFFGKSYGAGGSNVIIILALAAPAVAAANFGNILMKIRHQLNSLMATNIIHAATISGLALLWVDRGIEWVAIAWAVGHLVTALTSFTFIFLYRGQPTPVTTV